MPGSAAAALGSLTAALWGAHHPLERRCEWKCSGYLVQAWWHQVLTVGLDAVGPQATAGPLE
jgi:hypothetical protein